jgi:hypothetical protein
METRGRNRGAYNFGEDVIESLGDFQAGILILKLAEGPM